MKTIEYRLPWKIYVQKWVRGNSKGRDSLVPLSGGRSVYGQASERKESEGMCRSPR